MSDDKTAILSDCEKAVAKLQDVLDEGLEILKGDYISHFESPRGTQEILYVLRDLKNAVHLMEVNELFTLRRAIEQG